MHPSAPGLAQFLQQADAVALGILVALAVMSIGSWYLIIAKGVRSHAVRRRGARFLDAFWVAPDIGKVVHDLEREPPADPFGRLVQRGFTAIEHHRHSESRGLIDAGTPDEFLTRALKRAVDDETSRLEHGLSFLATVASSAPFVGLFGTVWGIYHALMAIGLSGQGSLDRVAGPVGEALIMTGIGLAVAIPASMAYNVFSRGNRRVLAQLNSFAHDLYSFLSTGMKADGRGPEVSKVTRIVAAKPAANQGR